MQFDLKKSLFVSMAALGFFAASATINANQANAKSYARVTSNSKMTSDATTRNVSFTGNNALYTKAGTLRGARIVATKATLSTLANSSSSSDNFRAYRVATTNRGSVYYKVVSFDRQYRGWIYGGKSVTSFGGGIKQFTTFNTGNLTTDQQNSLYKISNPGIANDGKTVTYQQPAWTQYQVGRQILDSTPYANTTFKITKVGTRTREGDQWVYIEATDSQYSQANGWILYSGLTQTQTPVADNAIRINLVDSSNNNTVVKSFDYAKTGAQKGARLGTQNGSNWTIPSADQTAIQNQANTALSGSGYYLGILNQTQMNALGQATFGSSVNIPVTKQSPVANDAVRINLLAPNGTFLNYVDFTKSGSQKGSNLGTWNGSTWSFYSGDEQNITNLINNALSNTGYYLTNGKLSSAQEQAIASGLYGSSVTITVTNTPTTATTKINPRQVGWGGSWFGSTQLNAVPDSIVNTSMNISGITGSGSGGSVTANDVAQWQSNTVDPANFKKLTDALSGNGTLATNFNNEFKQASQYQYVSPATMKVDMGASGTYFNGSDLVAKAKSAGLDTLESPVFPQYDSTSKTINWYRATYTINNADGGYSGNTVNAYYNSNYDNPTKVNNPS